MTGTPFIPKTLVVHLGTPSSNAENIYVDFPDYIKNVASSEVYPTWPESALRANIYAQISYVLNRYYTEWYRSQGYDFDITNSTQFDQSFVPGREIYDTISDIVDEIFNSYVVRRGSIEPYFTQYCNGTTSTCDGLSQWGTVPLAQQGLGPYDILTRFYGDDIDIVTDAPVRNGQPSYPGRPLRLGDAGNDVQQIQIRLNRISTNYPSIPKINPADGNFGVDTEEAVRAFQRTFRLTEDGIVGNATWYRITYLFNAVKRLSELDSEGIKLEDLPRRYEGLLALGDTGDSVRVIQYYLAVVAAYYATVPQVAVNGLFDQQTDGAVRAFQQAFDLPVDGIVGRQTWQKLEDVYESIRTSTELIDGGVVLFPGRVLQAGFQGEDVATIQEYLAYIATVYPAIPAPAVTGVYGLETVQAVEAFQRQFGLPETGTVGVTTWDAIASLYSDLRTGNTQRLGQFPGTELSEEGVAE
ncbi:MAG: spore cortex-lytic protein [Ruminococcaceae bacterium]|nr:spore cortex-lytic protein [Oscillospiraceae bacterium]